MVTQTHLYRILSSEKVNKHAKVWTVCLSVGRTGTFSGWIAVAALLTGTLSQAIYVYFNRLDESAGKNGSETG